MQSVYPVDLLSIKQVIEYSLVTVLPDTLLIEVIDNQMWEVILKEVIHALANTSVLEVSQIMSDRHIIPTETDIIKSQLQGQYLVLNQVENLMIIPVFTISPDGYLLTIKKQAKLQGLNTQRNLLQILAPLEIIKTIKALEAKIQEQTEQLRVSKQSLEYEIAQRCQIEQSLLQAQEQLEAQVQERTAALLAANTRLQKEIEEHRKAQQKIREQAALIDFVTDAIFVRDLDNHILFWSQGAEKLYGWTAAESVGKQAHKIFYRESLSQLEIGLKVTLETGYWQGELEQVNKAGKDIIVASRWTLVKDQFGQPESILVVNTDITEKKLLEQQFYRAQRLESIGTLASGIAHDLNNVFAPIMMIAQLLPLRCKNVDDRTQEMFKILETSSQRGANLVKQILTFARGKEGKPILLQPGILLKELVTVIKETFPKSIQISTHIPTNILWMVEADPTQLEQIFMNLAVNARDAMPDGGVLTIIAENRTIDQVYARRYWEAQPGDYVVFTIADTGMGISPQIIDRIFDPFFTTKEISEGTGLGLSTVLGIVKNHGGFVDVSSQVDKGTHFQVFLPRIKGKANLGKIEGDLPRGDGNLVLVVDDEDLIRHTIQETLEKYNYRTLVAQDGQEAIAIYHQHQSQISVVLVDMIMPNMDGIAVIKALKNSNSQLKIIATSGLPWEEKAIASGATKFLYKPYSVTDLLTTLSVIS
jgi:PAS domain S-box-containing protein